MDVVLKRVEDIRSDRDAGGCGVVASDNRLRNNIRVVAMDDWCMRGRRGVGNDLDRRARLFDRSLRAALSFPCLPLPGIEVGETVHAK